ncbi:acyl-homoserine-lactone synthase [Nocardia stercoris]|uniref:acyl-homoserine-lactone synthase n=1 Tax=Nocardia stercoris TaxID=2483361 RepID=A0A3M2KX21_9NOCA|nr:acyl-homoserine-lactone synthase [Nocardia stercoris]RMI30097.1 GNAT family N-acetyltransferase [Nocardia stercoris]
MNSTGITRSDPRADPEHTAALLGVEVVTGDRISPDLLDAMFRLRNEVFHRRLNWKVQSRNGREFDEFDRLAPHYVLVVDNCTAELLGSCRLLPTTGPYMIRDVFPQSLGDLRSPAHPQIWELSRLVVSPGQPFAGPRFGPVATLVVDAAVRCLAGLGARELVVFSHLDVERKFRNTGYPVTRLADPITIEAKLCTAYSMPVPAAAP